MRTWMITGASRGLGRAFTVAALAGGDRVIGVARDVAPLDELVTESAGALVTMALDVADRAAVLRVVEQARAVTGRLDVVVNNAGGVLIGMIEEITEEQARRHVDVNLFGALWVAQAVAPILRAQGGGHLLNISSMGSVGGFASTGLYMAGKAALGAVSDALAMELAGFGARVTLVGAGGFETELFTRGLTAAEPDPAYDELRAELAKTWAGSVDGDPAAAARVLHEIVVSARPPERVVLGSAAFDIVTQLYQGKVDEYAANETLSRRAGG